MERNWITKGIVLKTYRIGENHLGCLLATPERGNIQVILHGAASSKGKLRRGSEILSEHTYYLYEDPQKNSIKVTDLENSFVLDALRNSLEGYACATLATEIMIHLHTNGSPEMYHLFLEFLRELENHSLVVTNQISQKDSKNHEPSTQSLHPGSSYRKILNHLTITSVFLWKLMDSVGILPDLYSCVDTEETLLDKQTQWYSYKNSGFIFAQVPQNTMAQEHPTEDSFSNLVPLPFPGLRVIQWIVQQPLVRAMKEPLPDSVLVSTTLLGAGIFEHYLGRKLKTFEILRGLI